MTGEQFMEAEIFSFILLLLDKGDSRGYDILLRRVLPKGKREPASVVALDYGLTGESVYRIERQLLARLKAYLGFDNPWDVLWPRWWREEFKRNRQRDLARLIELSGVE